jgi:hypothetical protein
LDIDIIPKSELSSTDIATIVKNAHDAVLARATEKMLKDPIVRDGLPKSDFGLTGEQWRNETATVANTWTKDWSKTILATQVAIPYKIFDKTASPALSAIKFKGGTTGAKVLAQVSVEDLFLQDEVVGYFNYFDPAAAKMMLYDPQSTIYIELMSLGVIAQFAELIGYGFYIAEPAGEAVR